MEYLHLFFSIETVRAIAIYFWLILISLCLLANLFSLEKQGVQKMVGGLSVFIVALVANNVWLTAVSLFIGGLIIASEEFMQKLVIILRSESKDIQPNLAGLSSASPKEIARQDTTEALAVIDEKIKKPPAAARAQQYVSEGNVVERLMLQYLDEKYTSARFGFLTQQKLSDPEGSKESLVDAVLVRNYESRMDVRALIEIKYLAYESQISGMLNLVQSKVEDLAYLAPGKPIIFYFVVDEKLAASPKLMTLIHRLNKYAVKNINVIVAHEIAILKGTQITLAETRQLLDVLTQ